MAATEARTVSGDFPAAGLRRPSTTTRARLSRSSETSSTRGQRFKSHAQLTAVATSCGEQTDMTTHRRSKRCNPPSTQHQKQQQHACMHAFGNSAETQRTAMVAVGSRSMLVQLAKMWRGK